MGRHGVWGDVVVYSVDTWCAAYPFIGVAWKGSGSHCQRMSMTTFTTPRS